MDGLGSNDVIVVEIRATWWDVLPTSLVSAASSDGTADRSALWRRAAVIAPLAGDACWIAATR